MNGNVYSGQFKNDKPHGEGIEYDDKVRYMIVYSGEWKEGNWHGEGTKYNPDGSIKFKGKFENGVPVKDSRD